jgi:hypothetical protein
MSTAANRCRRMAVTLLRHAARVMPDVRAKDQPGADAMWADAMRRELDYITDDPAALHWALGCVLASYKARLAHRPSFSARTVWRQVAAGVAAMLLVGIALHDNAGGQTQPPPPAVEATPCDQQDVSQKVTPNTAAGIPRNGETTEPLRLPPDCADPPATDRPRGR